MQKYLLNKYFITIFFFLVWIFFFFDSTSWLVIKDLNKEIDKYEEQLSYYKSEYHQKNDAFYKKLMNNKTEKKSLREKIIL